MQIIAGKARSLELSAPPGIGVRPTAGRSRKALFDSIGGALAGSCVLDLFSGSGALALEAASRGAAVLWMVESNSRHAAVIEENIRKIRRAGVDASIELLRMSALDTAAWVRRIAPKPAFIFADPPYALKELPEVPTLVLERNLLRPGGVFVMEHSAAHDFSSLPLFAQHRVYGSVNFSIFIREE